MTKKFEALMKEIDEPVDKLKFHQIRYLFCNKWFGLTQNIDSAMTLMRHSDVKMT